MIKIIIVDDHEIVREGLVSLINARKEISVVGEAGNGYDALRLLAEKEVDVAVLDVEMPEMDGVKTTKMIREKFPHIKVLILTMHDKINYIRKIVEADAHGYVNKGEGITELVEAIQTVYEGEEYFRDDANKALRNGMKTKNVIVEIKLTKREVEVLILIANGYTTPEIAQKLGITSYTVETYRKILIEKTGARNAAHLAKFAVENGYC